MKKLRSMTKKQPATLKKLNLLPLVLFVVALNCKAQKNSSSQEPNHVAKGGSFGFTENKGQVNNQNREPRPDVLYGGKLNGLVFHLRKNGISYQLSRVDKWKPLQARKDDVIKPKSNVQMPEQTTLYRVDVNWIGAIKHAEVVKENELGSANLYYNQAGEFETHSFETIRYKNLYSGIDLKYYFRNGELKYDFECKAGSNYKKIKFEINGATGISLNEKGELVLETPLGNIIEHAPIVFQNGTELKSNWVLEKNSLSFNIQDLNLKLPYIIDPAIRVWGTYYGGSGQEEGLCTTTDVSGNVYLSGYTDLSTSSIIATSGAHQTSFGGGFFDAWLVKFNSSGVRQWATYYGGNDDDFGQSCAVDASGNIYLAGTTSSTAGIASAAGHQTVQGGGNQPDVFLVKFNSTGTRQWATYYGGNSYDDRGACAVDPSGNVYLSGTTDFSTSSSTVISTSGAYQSNSGGLSDAFLVKFNSSGVRQWATFYGGTNSENSSMCAAGTSSNIFLVGATGSTNSINSATACHQPTLSGFIDGFVVQFNSATGARIWGTYYGGENGDFANACATDASGNVFVSGTSNSTLTGAIATAASHLSVNVGGTNKAFLVKFNSSTGARSWGTYYGGEADETSFGCSTNTLGDVFISGTTTSTTGISTSGSYQTSLSVVYYNNAYLAGFNTNGTRQWGTYYGSDGEFGANCATDINGNIYLCGASTTTGGNVIASSGAHQSVFGGTTDAFLVKLSDCSTPAAPTNSTPTTNQTLCAGSNASISAVSGVNAITWYATLTGTTSLATGTAYVTNTLSAGNYTYYAEAQNGCGTSTRTAITLTVNAKPTISAGNGTICSGQSFTITPGGASSYVINGTVTTTSLAVSPTTTTNYSVTGTSSLGCASQNTAVAIITIGSSPTVSVNSASICAGATAVITPSGANTYSFIGISSGTSISVSPSVTTTYSIVGSNSACVSQNAAIATVTVYNKPTITASGGSICIGQSFVIVPSGANTYSITGNTFTVNPASTSSYSVSGTSTAGCVSNTPAIIQVTVSPQPSISASNGTVCSGGSFNLNPIAVGSVAVSSFSYVSGGNNFTVNPTSSTNYSIYATSVLGCTSSVIVASVTTTSPGSISANSGTMCPGQSFTIQPGGPATYSINGVAATSSVVSPASSTSYTITGTGCLSSSVAISNVTVLGTPTISANSATICGGLSVAITPSGASTYTITGGTFTVSPATTTSYSVTGTSSLGCNSASATVVQVSVMPTPTIAANGGTICAGQSFTIAASGAATYSFLTLGTPPLAPVNPASTTSYSIIGTSSLGCVGQNFAIANVVVNPAPTIVATSTAICNGQSYTLIPSGAINYSVSGTGAGTTFVLNPLLTTTYSVTGTNSFGCQSPSPVIVTVSVNPTPTITVPSSATICSGATAVITPSGAAIYSVSGISGVSFGSFSLSPSVTTSYSISGVSSQGCNSSSFAMVQVSVLPSPSFSILGFSGGGCIGKTFTISPTATGTVAISNYSILGYPAMTVTPSVTTTYSIIAFSAQGCRSQNSATTSLIIEAGPIITATSFTACVNSSSKIFPDGATNYSINGVPFQNAAYASVSPTVTTTYSITGIGGGLFTCPSVTPALCTVSVLSGSISVSNATICSGTSYTIKPSGGSFYSIQGGSFTVSPTASTAYTVSGTGSNGCPVTNPVTVSITVLKGPTLTVAPSYTVLATGETSSYPRDAHKLVFDCKGTINPDSTAFFTPEGKGISPSGNDWDVFDYSASTEKLTWNLPENYIEVYKNFTITVTDNNNCKASAQTQVYLKESLIIPNFFSPDGDGVNDTWYPDPFGLVTAWQIKDLNGEAWATYIPFYGKIWWDGTHQNDYTNNAPDGVYTYVLYTRGKQELKGTITLKRKTR